MSEAGSGSTGEGGKDMSTAGLPPNTLRSRAASHSISRSERGLESKEVESLPQIDEFMGDNGDEEVRAPETVASPPVAERKGEQSVSTLRKRPHRCNSLPYFKARPVNDTAASMLKRSHGSTHKLSHILRPPLRRTSSGVPPEPRDSVPATPSSPSRDARSASDGATPVSTEALQL